MATDIDIDMDLDIDPVEDYAVQEALILPIETETQPPFANGSTSLPVSESDAIRPTPNKVHLRGLDNLTSSDLKVFSSKYFGTEQFERIEWIDDTSANLVYATPALALAALSAFTSAETNDVSKVPLLQMLPAKPFPNRPETRLEARLAVLGDKKQAGARERSKFYLFNPDHDPAERRMREGYSRRGGRRYRDRDGGSYRGQEDREGFDVSLYDDDEVTRAVRVSKTHSSRESRSSISSGEYRGLGVRKAHFTRGAGKELFPDRIPRRGSGRLRDRSASPLCDSDGDHNMDSSRADRSNSRLRNANISSSANRLQAQMIKAKLKETSLMPKELFPQKASINHRRSDAFDATDATADLFSSRMPVPFLDGSSDTPPQKRDLMSRITKAKLEDRVSAGSASDQTGFSIRGTAKQQQTSGISIKGIAVVHGTPIKELFPSKAGLNSGKELFSEKLEGRGGQRRRAEDMFY